MQSNQMACRTPPWNGEKMPRTLELTDETGLLTFLSLSPDEFRSSIAFCSIKLCSMFLTQITFSRPFTATMLAPSPAICHATTGTPGGGGVTVKPTDDGVLVRPRRHRHLYRWILLGELWQVVF